MVVAVPNRRGEEELDHRDSFPAMGSFHYRGRENVG